MNAHAHDRDCGRRDALLRLKKEPAGGTGYDRQVEFRLFFAIAVGAFAIGSAAFVAFGSAGFNNDVHMVHLHTGILVATFHFIIFLCCCKLNIHNLLNNQRMYMPTRHVKSAGEINDRANER
jgi:hypothetical protein